MSNTTTTEKNETIALYMGAERKTLTFGKGDPDEKKVEYICFNREAGGIINTAHIKPNELSYHDNDSWLMPVARKVHKQLEYMIVFKKKLMPIEFIEQAQELLEQLVKSFPLTISELHEATYQAIVFLNSLKPGDK